MRISDWSSDVCSSDLSDMACAETASCHEHIIDILRIQTAVRDVVFSRFIKHGFRKKVGLALVFQILLEMYIHFAGFHYNRIGELSLVPGIIKGENIIRSEEHTSELQSLMRISYAVF